MIEYVNANDRLIHYMVDRVQKLEEACRISVPQSKLDESIAQSARLLKDKLKLEREIDELKQEVDNLSCVKAEERNITKCICGSEDIREDSFAGDWHYTNKYNETCKTTYEQFNYMCHDCGWILDTVYEVDATVCSNVDTSVDSPLDYLIEEKEESEDLR